MDRPGPASSPLDPAIAGWHLTPRAWRASEAYRALRTAEARHVAELVLFDRPRFREETHYFGGKAFIVRRGQLFDGEETIAALAGTTRKVVRTVLRTLITASLITREKVHPSGQCPHVITVRDYDRSQALPRSGASETAEDGPEKGPTWARGVAPSQPQEHQEPHEAPPARAREAGAAHPEPRRLDGTYASTGRLSPLPRRDELLAAKFPETAKLLGLLDAGGWRVGYAADDIGRGAIERGVVLQGAEVVAERLLAMVRAERAAGREPRPTLGWHQALILGAPQRGDVRFGMAAPAAAPDFGEEGEHDLATGKVTPPLWSKLAQAARATTGRDGLARDLARCKGDVVGGELVIAPPDTFVALRLVDLHHVEEFARAALPGTPVRVAAAPAAAAAGGAP